MYGRVNSSVLGDDVASNLGSGLHCGNSDPDRYDGITRQDHEQVFKSIEIFCGNLASNISESLTVDTFQVRAIVVYDEARREAHVESRDAGQVNGEHACPSEGEPEAAGTVGFCADEEVFIAQLHRRAQLLNEGFQRLVIDIVNAHAAVVSSRQEIRKSEDKLGEPGPPCSPSIVSGHLGWCGASEALTSASLAVADQLTNGVHGLGKSNSDLRRPSVRDRSERRSSLTRGSCEWEGSMALTDHVSEFGGTGSSSLTVECAFSDGDGLVEVIALLLAHFRKPKSIVCSASSSCQRSTFVLLTFSV